MLQLLFSHEGYILLKRLTLRWRGRYRVYCWEFEVVCRRTTLTLEVTIKLAGITIKCNGSQFGWGQLRNETIKPRGHNLSTMMRLNPSPQCERVNAEAIAQAGTKRV